jgi:peptidyl-prolyl cis-trans isomerase SurA
MRGLRAAAVRALGLGAAAALLAGTGGAQIVKAPRYESGVTTTAVPAAQAPVPAAITPGGTVVEDVVVRVNDQIISRSDLERAQEQLTQELGQNNAPPAEVAEKEKNLLRDLIDQQLLLSRAKELGLNADAEVIRRLDEIRKQNHLESMEDLEKAAKSQGVSFEDFKAQIRNSILSQQVVRDEVGRHLQMTQAEELAYYNTHKAELSQPEQIRLSEILIPVADTASTDAVAQAQEKAKLVASKLASGAKFEELAKQYSGGSTASEGGDLGLFKRGAMAKVLDDQTFVLQAGESTQPIRTRQGFVILKVTEHLAAGAPPLKEVEPQIQEAMYMAELAPALRAYLTKLRVNAYVDIKPGFIDSGASAKETKPVFSAYAPPPVKKKKENGGRLMAVNAAKPVISSPDTTGGRTYTGRDAGTAPAAAKVDPNTGLGVVAAPKNAPVAMKNGKPKKVHREKVRFGQAPRTTLPSGAEQPVASGSIGTASTLEGQPVAPGAAMASLGTSPELANAEDPLAARPVEHAKTRFGDRPDVPKVNKVKALSAKAAQKDSATQVGMTQEEKAAAQTQDAPLGLNGDTATKKKPAKPKKGDPKPEKERLEDKQKVVPTPAPAPEPTANPALAPTADTPPSTKAAAPKP